MNMIEVDPKLFVKCRLCLEKTGQYQIVPKAQMQIKYCFDIDVAPFDGLPQLICKKCESILTEYGGIKRTYQRKQKNLNSKINAKVKIDSIIQQQDTVNSTQADIEYNKNKLEIPSSSKIINRNNKLLPKRHSSTETLASNSQRKKRKSTESKRTKRKWKKAYTKHFVCRYCAKTFRDKKGINTHITKHCKLFKKYSNINKSYCLVALNKIGTEPNITGSIDKVVCNQNKIVQSRKANYYILYNKLKDNDVSSSESSDDDFFVDKKKRKRRRLISRSSTETVLIDNDAAKSSNEEKIAKTSKSENMKIEYVNIDDSDSNSTKSSVKKGFDSDTQSENPQNEMQKDLVYLKNVQEYETQNIFEQSLQSDAICGKASPNVEKPETKLGDNTHLRSVLDANTNWKNLLNANPVANPKKLPNKISIKEPASILKVYSDDPKYNSEFIEHSNMDPNNEMLHMPIITSTVSLPPPPPLEQANVEGSNQNTTELNNNSSKPKPSIPKIKLKPISQLLTAKALNQHRNECVSSSGLTVNKNNQNQNVLLQATDNNIVYLGPFTNTVPIQQELIYYPQWQGM